jgi:hypothetical protein
VQRGAARYITLTGGGRGDRLGPGGALLNELAEAG